MRWSLCFIFLLIHIFCAPLYCEEAEECSESSPCKVGVKTLVFFDVARERPVITEVYYPQQGDKGRPSEQKPLPLIVLSHGYLGDRYSHAWLQEALAASGYIVAVPDHFGSTHYMQRPEDSLKRWDRPKDISFVIDNILKDPFFKKNIDPEKIGFVGYSLGGLTGVWLAGGISTKYPVPDAASASAVDLDEGTTQKVIDSIDFSKAGKSYEDKRIRAAFLMAPGYGKAFDQEGLSSIEIPMVIVATDDDAVYPVDANARFFAENIKSSALKVISQGGHYVFLNEEERACRHALPSYMIKDPPGIDRVAVHKEVASMAIKFFDKYVKKSHHRATESQRYLETR